MEKLYKIKRQSVNYVYTLAEKKFSTLKHAIAMIKTIKFTFLSLAYRLNNLSYNCSFMIFKRIIQLCI